jgi:hypothetical protein
MLGIMMKEPADQRDYDIDFSRWLPDGDTVTTAVATVDPPYDAVLNPTGLQVTSIGVTSPIVKVWVNGGVSGITYKVSVTTSTSGGRIKEVDFKIRVKDE